ncbi:uncharacterized protein LOC110628987 isoform X2 [Manihot esculenta]|uniref:Uncharacterized protein n=1 Tax=Manihot esculenta TaxID=3983 RepID=A0A2C9WK42_MANES|nr:uncharacterized protein LOC110628987 isoform X2 [Manihot esculenta]OAY60013.1 hypothetical protein MANES_01G079300v8 [Manihot esculenta]
MSLLLICLLICFSLHACNARYIGLSAKETRTQDFTKDVLRVNLYETSVSSEMNSPIPEEFQAQREEVGEIDRRRRIPENSLGAGHKLIVSSQRNLQQTAKIEGLKKQARSYNKKALESGENDIVEDVVVMDYAQPHRKPPIHNEKP